MNHKAPNIFIEARYVQLGEFVLDLEQQLLFHNQVEIAAEPKVLQLLVYFYQNHTRYISLEELHQQLWINRIVSDTAVRNTVKKLRLLLNDDQSNPVYLKSVSKRGYKLICAIHVLQVFPLECSHLGDRVVTEETLAANGGYAADFALKGIHAQRQFHYKKILLLLVSFLLLAISTSWYNLRDSSMDHAPATKSLQITNFEGEKSTLTVSADGRYIAFTGQMSLEQPPQVYLFDQQTKHLRQLTTKAKNPFFVTFVHNDKGLVYSDSITGDSSIHLLPLTVTEPELAASTLVSGKYLIGQLAEGRHAAEILFVMMEPSETAAMVYSLDVNTKAINRVVTVSQPNTIIYGLRLSPDKQKLALLKRQNKEEQLVIVDFSTKKQLRVIDLPSQVIGLNWRNKHELLMLDSHKIQLLDIVDGRTRVVHENPEGLISAMSTHDGEQLLLIQKQKARSDRLLIEQALMGDSPTSTIIDIPEQTTSARYSNNEQYLWLTLRNDSIFSIARIVKGKQVPEVIYQSSHQLEILDIDELNQRLLLKENNRLMILSEKNGATLYLTSLGDIVSDAVFSRDRLSVLYGQQVAGRWEIIQYDLKTSGFTVLYSDFRTVRQADVGYVLADEKGQLFYHKTPGEPPLNLARRISFEHISRWFVNKNKIVWTTFDYRESFVHQLQLDSSHYQVLRRPYRSLFPNIAIHPNAEHFLYLSFNINQSNLSLLSLDDK